MLKTYASDTKLSFPAMDNSAVLEVAKLICLSISTGYKDDQPAHQYERKPSWYHPPLVPYRMLPELSNGININFKTIVDHYTPTHPRLVN